MVRWETAYVDEVRIESAMASDLLTIGDDHTAELCATESTQVLLTADHVAGQLNTAVEIEVGFVTQVVTLPDSEITTTITFVPTGTFIMGSEDDASDERPVHEVDLDAFWIDLTEVTVGQYQAFYDAVGRPSNHSYTGNENLQMPVRGISWYAAQAFCEWRGGRLPTEAEWEKAARGTDGRTYPWGEEIDSSLANYSNHVGRITEVGSYPDGASPYGVLDMAGNVREWTQSEYVSYPYIADDGRNEDSMVRYRVLRGGSWNNNGSNLRASNRNFNNPTLTNDNVGGRCIQEVSP